MNKCSICKAVIEPTDFEVHKKYHEDLNKALSSIRTLVMDIYQRLGVEL